MHKGCHGSALKMHVLISFLRVYSCVSPGVVASMRGIFCAIESVYVCMTVQEMLALQWRKKGRA